MATVQPTIEEIEHYRDEVFLKFPTPPCAKTLGWKLVEIDVREKRAVVEFQATETMLNPAGTIQGGFLTAMLDDTMGPLMHVMSAGTLMPSSTDIHTQFLRPAYPGVVRCEAHIMRQARTLNFVRADLFNSKGQKLASAVSTAVMLPFKKR